jgi:hypothetical protein
MTKDKQIEHERSEISEIIAESFKPNDEQYDASDFEWSAHCLLQAGYRKQVVGEWKRSERSKYDFFCTVCGEKAVQNIYGNYDRLFKFCPHCGAKMKGE